MNIQLPEKVQQIIKTLQGHGYEAYAVGGCVRDSLLGYYYVSAARRDQSVV